MVEKLYFLAIVAPPAVEKVVKGWKNWMLENFGCQVALRSPGHITLVPPFKMDEELEEQLREQTKQFAAGRESFALHLRNFSCFKPRTIFVDLVRNENLERLKSDLDNWLLSQNKFPIKKEDRPFHPHLTIANRDLAKKDFYPAWEFFKNKEWSADWPVNSISILRHNKKNWDVVFTSQFE